MSSRRPKNGSAVGRPRGIELLAPIGQSSYAGHVVSNSSFTPMRAVSSPYDEAIESFDEVRRNCIQRTRPLVEDLRRCLDACRLLGWTEKHDWLRRELNGYGAKDKVPAYRKVEGYYQWVTYHGPGYETDVRSSKPRVRQFRERAADLVRMKQDDHEEVVHERGFAVPSHRIFVPQRRMQEMVDRLTDAVFEFASDSYSLLKYGNVLTDVWSHHRTEVDRAVVALGIAGHLDTIEQNLRSDTLEAWQAAAFACRTLLERLSEHLWQDPRDTYDMLMVPNPKRGPNEPREVPLDVRRGRYANRLGAYLHQKAVTDDNRYFVVAQTEYLAGAIRALVSWEGHAHSAFSRADANSVALATYFLLGELAIKTDLQPVMQYVSSREV